jgi:hypothetical protein
MNIKIAALLAISLLKLLDKIYLKIVMHIGITNRMIGVQKARNPLFSPLRTHESYQVIEGLVQILAIATVPSMETVEEH